MTAIRGRSKPERHAGRQRLLLGAGAAAVAVGLLVAAIIAAGGGGRTGAATNPAPAASFEMIDGSPASFADYRGTPLVVNFFASWCVPCLAEMPGFEHVHQDLDGQVAFLGMNVQDRVEDGLRVVEQTGITYDVARDPQGSLFQAFEAFAMPTTVFIDADGNIVDLQSGEISAGALDERIDELLLSS